MTALLTSPLWQIWRVAPGYSPLLGGSLELGLRTQRGRIAVIYASEISGEAVEVLTEILLGLFCDGVELSLGDVLGWFNLTGVAVWVQSSGPTKNVALSAYEVGMLFD